METIAEFSFPKQRMTRKYSVVLCDISVPQNPQWVIWYRLENGNHDSGEYHGSLESAWKGFTERVKRQFNYGPATWDCPEEITT